MTGTTKLAALQHKLATSTSTRYNELREESNRYGETNDCSVVATAMVLDLSYNDAHALLYKLGRRARAGFNTMRLEVHLGSRCSKRVYPTQPNGSNYTIKTVPSLLPLGKHLIFTAGHVLACINGSILDWTEDRKHRVRYYVSIDAPEDILDLL